MRTQRPNEAKVAVYCASLPASEEQRSQDMWIAALMILSALTVAGLRYFA